MQTARRPSPIVRATFVGRLDRELEIEGPRFLAIHLTLAHWPYSWAGKPLPTTPRNIVPPTASARRWSTASSLTCSAARGQGCLDNAIVVVLSDHGEALGFQSDSMLRKTGTSREIWDSLWGHGTSVMSPHQYGVRLRDARLWAARLPGQRSVHDWPVALEDVRPTLQELVTGRRPAT